MLRDNLASYVVAEGVLLMGFTLSKWLAEIYIISRHFRLQHASTPRTFGTLGCMMHAGFGPDSNTMCSYYVRDQAESLPTGPLSSHTHTHALSPPLHVGRGARRKR